MKSDAAGLAGRLGGVGEPARSCSLRLRTGLTELLGDDVVAMWLYGGQLAPGGSTGDVDLHVIVRREPCAEELERIRELHEAICRDLAIPELDAWYVLLEEARSTQPPKDVNWPVEVRDENWAIKRAHWFAGAYVLIHGTEPKGIVPRPHWSEIEAELLAQIAEAMTTDDHRHAAGLTLRLCRVLLSLVTRDVVHFKVDSAEWALDRLTAPSREHVAAALRVYRGVAKTGDHSLIAGGMATFCAEIRLLAYDTPR